MKKCKAYLKRFVACLLIVFSLSFTTAGSVLGTQELTVYATGGELTILKALIEVIMASMGLAYSSTADLNNAAAGLNSVLKNNDFISKDERWAAIAETMAMAQLSGTVNLSYSQYGILKEYLYNQAVDRMSSAADVASPSLPIVPGASTKRLDIATELTVNDFFYGKKIDLFGGKECIGFSSDILASSVIVTVLRPDEGKAKMFVYAYPSISIPDEKIYVNSKDFVLCSYDASSTEYLNGSLEYFSAIYNGKLNYVKYYSYYTYSYLDDAWGNNFYGVNDSTQQICLGEAFTSGGIPCTFDESLGYQVRIFLDDETKIYDSLESYQMLHFSSIFAPTAPVFGKAATAKPLEKDEAGNIVVPLPLPSVTERVEQAVNSAVAANPSITEEELNAAASDVIAAQNGTTDAVNQNTATLATLLTSILSIFRVTSENVAKIAQNAVTDGTSALKLDDIAEQFKVIEGGATNPEPEEPEEPDKPPGEPKIWKWTPVGFEFLKLFDPLFKFFSEPLSIVTESLSTIWKSIEEIPGNISAAFQEWVVPQINGLKAGLESFAQGLANLPKNIAASIKEIEWPPLEVPEIAVPPLEIPDISLDASTLPQPINYTSPLARIVELLENMFVIDTVAIGNHIKGVENVWRDNLSFAGKTEKLFADFNFSDNYHYPVIQLKTPDVLKTFYSDEYIILLDFANYKEYCLWARNIVKAWLWFCFALSIFNHIKTNLHIG